MRREADPVGAAAHGRTFHFIAVLAGQPARRLNILWSGCTVSVSAGVHQQHVELRGATSVAALPEERAARGRKVFAFENYVGSKIQ